MLQVPCLSPPIYGRSHYKKFWLRQTAEVKDPSSVGVATSCDHMKSASASTGAGSASPDLGSASKRIGKRRPQHLRSALSSASSERIKVAVNHESGSSPTSSGEFHAWKASSPSNKAGSSDAASSPFSSTVVDVREADLDEETPKSLVIQRDSGKDHKFLVPLGDQGVELVDPAAEVAAMADRGEIGGEEEEEEEEDKVLVVRQNMISFEDDPASEQTALDCLTSKCKSGDRELGTDSRQDLSNSSAESDSTTSSTSQASDDHDDDARSQSEKSSSFRQFAKRHPKGSSSSEIDQLLLGSPRTRLAAAASGAASIDSPVSPSGRSPRLDGMGSVAAHGNSNVFTRTCKHCGTMKTPLWRNGPLGPKSLCNACGIRLRKARRNNMNHENGGNGQAPATASTVSGKRKLDASAAPPRIITGSGDLRHPYKKSRLAFAREKREMGGVIRLAPHDQQQQRNGSSNNNTSGSGSSKLGRSLSKDEEEGAVLLMALSCGLVLA